MLLDDLPAPDEIARFLGLQAWRVGQHEQAGRDSADSWVHYIWQVSGHPSFDAGFVLAGVQADDWIDEPGSGPIWRKAMFASGGAAEFIHLRSDRVAHGLSQIALIPPLGSPSLDGISYSVRVESMALRATFSFGNPEHAPLIKLEQSLLRLADRIAESSGNARLHESVQLWKRYCTGRHRRTKRGT